MAEVIGGDVPPNVLKELEAFVVKQCLQLHAMETLLGTPERGKQVADFMKDVCHTFLTFNIAERSLVVQFIGDTNLAVQAAMEASGVCNPLSSYKTELDRLIRASAELAKDAYEPYKEDKDRKAKP